MRRQVLIVEQPGGPLGELIASFSGNLLDAHVVADAPAAVAALSEQPLVSLVVIDDTLGDDAGARLLGAVKDQHSEMPVLWTSTHTLRLPVSPMGRAPDLYLEHPVTPQTFEDAVSQLLKQHFYPAALAERLGQSCVEAVRSAFGVELAVVNTCLRANRTALGSVAALVPFVGPRISGRVSVSSTEATLHGVHRCAFGHDAGDDDALHDLAGEYANLVAGQLKSLLSQHELGFTLGTPIILLGGSMMVAQRASQPGFLLTLDGDAGVVHITVSFEVLGDEHVPRAFDDEAATIEAGEMLLF